MLEALIGFRQGCGRSVLWQYNHSRSFSLCITLTDYTLIRIKHLCSCCPVIEKSLSFVTAWFLLCLSACCLAELLWDALSCCKDLLVFTENQTKHLCSFTKKRCCALETLEPVMPFSPLLTFTNVEWLSLPKILQIFFLQYKPQIWNTSCLDLYYTIEIVIFHIINKLILLY